MLAQISAAPPPYTTRLSRTRFLTTHSASCSARFASSMIWIASAIVQTRRQGQLGEETPHVTHHLVTASDEHRDCTGVGTLLDDEHLLPCRPERYLPHQSRPAEFLHRQVLEPGHDPAIGRNGDELTNCQFPLLLSKRLQGEVPPRSPVPQPIAPQEGRFASTSGSPRRQNPIGR